MIIHSSAAMLDAVFAEVQQVLHQPCTGYHIWTEVLFIVIYLF